MCFLSTPTRHSAIRRGFSVVAAGAIVHVRAKQTAAKRCWSTSCCGRSQPRMLNTEILYHWPVVYAPPVVKWFTPNMYHRPNISSGLVSDFSSSSLKNENFRTRTSAVRRSCDSPCQRPDDQLAFPASCTLSPPLLLPKNNYGSINDVDNHNFSLQPKSTTSCTSRDAHWLKPLTLNRSPS